MYPACTLHGFRLSLRARPHHLSRPAQHLWPIHVSYRGTFGVWSQCWGHSHPVTHNGTYTLGRFSAPPMGSRAVP